MCIYFIVFFNSKINQIIKDKFITNIIELNKIYL